MDLDGTLLDDNWHISSYTLSVLKACQKRGIIIAVASARSMTTAESIIDLVQPDFSILGDGSSIYDKNKIVIHNELFWLEGFAEIDYDFMETLNLDKMNAVIILSDIQKIDLSDVVAFGDGFNDIGMLCNCGTGVAMDNASESVKKCAKYTCGSNNEDGIAYWIQENILSGAQTGV